MGLRRADVPNGFRPLAHVREVHRPTRMEQPRSLLELAVEPGGLVRECHSARVCRNARGGGRAEVWRTV